jgi:hypothetical protein
MNRTFILAGLVFLSSAGAFGQPLENSADYRPGSGLDIRLNNGNCGFNLGAFIQSGFRYVKPDGAPAETRFDVRHSFFSLGGFAKKEKISFLLQTDFSNVSPLLDAWVAFHPWKFLTVSAGQKQTFTGNREMTFHESRLAMTDRSLLSRTFSATGREFGLFVESRLDIGRVVLQPAIAVTSGDGRNSFGTSSIDIDYGGLKYGGRLDICPLGAFSPGNDRTGADLAREKNPRLKAGIAGSYNQGVSDAVGEGHGGFTLYGENGRAAYPDYRKIHADILFKWRGISLLAEYANASATAVRGLFSADNGIDALVPGEISHYLCLGNSYNVQLGYVARNGLTVDVRYTRLSPEFAGETASVLQETDVYDVNIGKYFAGNMLKLQGGVSSIEHPLPGAGKQLQAEIMLQVIF